MSFSFSRNLRLSNQKYFIYTDEYSYRMNIAYLSVLGFLNFLEYPRLRISVSKKKLRLSSKRNLVKRLIKESFRLNQHSLPKADFIFSIRKKIELISNQDLFRILDKVWLEYRLLHIF